MKTKQARLHISVAFTVVFGLMLGTVASLSLPSSAQAAGSLTTWQKFIRDKCGGGTADAAAACAKDLNNRLRKRCGKPEQTDAYKDCWRKFIINNGGTAGPNSDPFEDEVPQGGDDDSNEPGITDDYEVNADAVGIPTVNANNVVKGVLNTVYFIAGIAAVIVLVIAGILYATSAGDAAKVKQAKDAILYAVVGLIVVMMAFTITGFVMGGIG